MKNPAILFVLILVSCGLGDHIVNDDYKAHRVLSHGTGIWNLISIEKYTIMADGTQQNYVNESQEFRYWQFLFQADMLLGVPAEYFKANIVRTNAAGTVETFNSLYAEIEDVRLTLGTGALGAVDVFNLEEYGREYFVLTQVDNATFQKTIWTFEYCDDCEPAMFEGEEDQI